MSLLFQNPIPATVARLDSRRMLGFGLPLVLTSVLVALSGPALNVTLGRAADPTLDLAAFWVAFTIVLFIESGALAIQQATLALGADRGPLTRIAGVAIAIGAASSLVVLAVAWPPISSFVFQVLVPTTSRAATLAQSVLFVLAPLPLLVAVRGLAAAVALRRGRSRLVAIAAALRIGVLALAIAIGFASGATAGAHAAAVALLSGTAAETALLIAMTWPRVRARLQRSATPGARIPERGVLPVLLPLVVASLAWTATRPVVNAALGRLADPELAQAAFGVTLPILMVACAPLWALREISVVLPRRPGDLAAITRFATISALVFTAGIALLAFTPQGGIVLGSVFGLSPEMRGVVMPAIALLALEPLALATRAVAQGVLLRARRTGALLAFAPLRLAAMLAAGVAIAAAFPNANGALLGVALVVGGDVVDAVLCAVRARRVLVAGGFPARSSRSTPADSLPPDAVDFDSTDAVLSDVRFRNAA